MKFQLFNVTNENFVGYTQYDRAIEANNVRTSVDNAYTVLHRPQIVNWLHMTTAESREMAKKEIAIQGALSVSSPALFSYSAVTVERKKYNNREFVNPVNQSKVWTPYSPVSTPRSLHPYDFRPKQIFESYNINANKLKLVILDEADEMLSSGFKEQVYNVFKYLDTNVQIALFSATLPENIFTLNIGI